MAKHTIVLFFGLKRGGAPVSKVVVFGTGSFAQVAHFLLTHDSDHEVVAFTVNESHLTDPELMG